MAQRGSLRLRAGIWYGSWSSIVIDGDTGNKRRRQYTFKLGPKSIGKLPAARALAKHIEATEVPGGRSRPDARITFEEFARTRWLPTREAKWRSFTNAKGKVSNPAKEACLYALGHIFKGLGKVPLEDIDSVMLQKWLNGLGTKYSESLVKHCRTFVKSILEWAVWEDYVPKNQAKFLTLPKTKSVKKNVLTKDQFIAVLKAVNESSTVERQVPDGLLLKLALFTAMRPSELLALRWRDFDPVTHTFMIRETLVKGVLRPFTKTTDQHEPNKGLLRVAIPEALSEELQTARGPRLADGCRKGMWTSDNDFIFSTYRGTPRTREKVLLNVLKPVKKKLGLSVLNFQVLRRTMATLSQHSGSIKDIQSHLRHRSPDVTATEYVQEIPDSARNMVATVYNAVLEPDSKEDHQE